MPNLEYKEPIAFKISRLFKFDRREMITAIRDICDPLFISRNVRRKLSDHIGSRSFFHFEANFMGDPEYNAYFKQQLNKETRDHV